MTGRITPLNAEAHRTPEFLAHNDWIADPERVRRLASDGASRTVFLCGLVGNEEEVRALFDKVVLLSIDEATMRHRLALRTSHDFGARPHELDLLVTARDVIEQYYRGTGAIIIDASRTPAVVADDILDNLES